MKKVLDGRSEGSLFVIYEMLYFWSFETLSKGHLKVVKIRRLEPAFGLG